MRGISLASLTLLAFPVEQLHSQSSIGTLTGLFGIQSGESAKSAEIKLLKRKGAKFMDEGRYMISVDVVGYRLVAILYCIDVFCWRT